MLHPILRKVLDYALLALAIFLVVATFEWYSARSRDKAAEALVKELAKSVQRTSSEQSPRASLRSAALAAAEQYLNQSRDNGLRFERAGSMFLSAYIPLAEILPDICIKVGVAVPTFQRAFTELHKDVLARARRRVEGTPVAEAKLRAENMAKWTETTERSLQELATSKDSTVEAECKDIESSGADVAARENLAGSMPIAYAILYE